MTNWWETDTVSSLQDETKLWKFKVEANTHPGEVLCVTGDCGQLGNWINDKALVLSHEGDKVWSNVANVTANSPVRYRYFVCIPLENGSGEQKLIVRRWETGINPRIISAQATSNVNNCDSSEVFGSYNNETAVESGWLTSETVVQIQLHSIPVKMWSNKLTNRKLSIKVSVASLNRKTSDSQLPLLDKTSSVDNYSTWPLSQVAVMNEEQRNLQFQNQFGQPYVENEFLLFQIMTDKFESTAYLIEFFTADDLSGEVPTHVGFCHILPSVLTHGMGTFIVPITNAEQRIPIGELKVNYLVVTPLSDVNTDMKITFSSQWKKSWQGLDVGHRGSGVSFGCDIECADVRENTIASLKSAGNCGADLVEFDVQLSKDHIPVIYHDYYVAMSTQNKIGSNDHSLNDVIKVPIKDLTLNEMRSLKFYHVKEGDAKTKTNFSEDTEEEHQPFPTLQQALEIIDPSVGFNVEIKWSMQIKDGSYELDHPIEINLYIDTILGVLLQYAHSRNIVLSSFHPDIVTILRLKQNKYPVMFLTQGITSKWPQYKDPRCHNVIIGMQHAVSANILGLAVHAEDLLRDDSQIKLINDSGLEVWCWGVDVNIPANIEHLKKLGVQAVINDRVRQLSTKNESVFLIEARKAAELLTRLK